MFVNMVSIYAGDRSIATVGIYLHKQLGKVDLINLLYLWFVVAPSNEMVPSICVCFFCIRFRFNAG